MEVKPQLYRVLYNNGDEVRSYTVDDMPKHIAERYLKRFKDTYVGKPYPNGKGFYPFTNPRVVPVS